LIRNSWIQIWAVTRTEGQQLFAIHRWLPIEVFQVAEHLPCFPCNQVLRVY